MLVNEKKKFVEEFTEELKNADTIIVANYQGLAVNAMTELRQKLRNVNCKMSVVKNTLAKRAIAEISEEMLGDFSEAFSGPSAVLLTGDDPVEAVKIYKEYAKEVEIMEFKAGVYCGRVLDKDQILQIAELPPREVLIAKTVNVLNAPLQGLYNSLSGIITKLLYALNDFKGKKKDDESEESDTSEETPKDTENAKEETTEEAAVEEKTEESAEEKSPENESSDAKQEDTEITESPAESEGEETSEGESSDAQQENTEETESPEESEGEEASEGESSGEEKKDAEQTDNPEESASEQEESDTDSSVASSEDTDEESGDETESAEESEEVKEENKETENIDKQEEKNDGAEKE